MMKQVWIRIMLLTMVLVMMLCLVPLASAQVTPMPYIVSQWFDNNGHPCSGCKLYTYAAGTTTPLGTFSDALGITPNTNPVTLDSFGRANVFLSSSSYKFTLKTSGGTQFWSIDNITASNLSLLASNNTWTGTNTFNAATIFNGSATFNVGLTSSGPNVLNGGGTITGTYTGAATFSGNINFSGGFTATTGSFSGQITSTVTTGTAPFVIASTTKVSNLNVDLLDGCDWAIPCPIGSTTPNTAVFTTLQANTSFTLNGGTAQTGTQGTNTTLLTSSTVTGTGATLCVDAQGGATTSGCAAGSFTALKPVSFCASGCVVTVTPCSTGSSTYDTCDTTLTWPAAFADTDYVVTCSGLNMTDDVGSPAEDGYAYIHSKSASNVVMRTVNVVAEGSGIKFQQFHCIGIHP